MSKTLEEIAASLYTEDCTEHCPQERTQRVDCFECIHAALAEARDGALREAAPVWTTTACPHCGGEVDGIRVLKESTLASRPEPEPNCPVCNGEQVSGPCRTCAPEPAPESEEDGEDDDREEPCVCPEGFHVGLEPPPEGCGVDGGDGPCPPCSPQVLADLRARVIGRMLGASPEVCLDVGRAYLASEPACGVARVNAERVAYACRLPRGHDGDHHPNPCGHDGCTGLECLLPGGDASNPNSKETT